MPKCGGPRLTTKEQGLPHEDDGGSWQVGAMGAKRAALATMIARCEREVRATACGKEVV